MGNNNTNLQAAKNTKDDEFYTTYETIEEELSHYVTHFDGKVVLCNCDDPFESNFCRFFLRNFNNLGLKRLICTSYRGSKIIATQATLFDSDSEQVTRDQGYVLDVNRFPLPSENLTDERISLWLQQHRAIKKLKGDGDFRSKECLRYLGTVV